MKLAFSVAAWASVVLLAGSARAQEQERSVNLHVDSPYVVQVERRGPGANAWEAVCTSPCDIEVPVLGEYRVRGRGVTTSAPIPLQAQGASGGSVVLQVKPGSKNKAKRGWFVIGAGAAAVFAGAVIDAVGTSQGQAAGQGGPGDPGTNSNARDNFYLAGTAIVVAGLVAAVFGGSLVYDNAHSTVRENDAPAPLPPATPAAPADGSRDPILRTENARLDGAPAAMLPIFTATF